MSSANLPEKQGDKALYRTNAQKSINQSTSKQYCFATEECGLPDFFGYNKLTIYRYVPKNENAGHT